MGRIKRRHIIEPIEPFGDVYSHTVEPGHRVPTVTLMKPDGTVGHKLESFMEGGEQRP